MDIAGLADGGPVQGTLFGYVAIPTIDFERARRFWGAILGQDLARREGGPFPMAYLPDSSGGIRGHLFQLDGFSPSCQGAILYLNLGLAIDEVLDRVVRGGGRVVHPHTSLGPGKGRWALFLDSEGNRLALHEPP